MEGDARRLGTIAEVDQSSHGQHKERYNSIDVAKFLMAIVVVAIHTGPLYGCDIPLFNNIYSFFTKSAVPFFFISSGFLLAKKMDGVGCDAQRLGILRGHLGKTVKLYLLWTMIYLPLSIYGLINTHESVKTAVFEFAIKVCFVGENYNSWILWYLLSTIYALLFVVLLRKVGLHPLVISIIGAGIYFGWQAIECSGLLGAVGSGVLPSVFVLITNIIGSGRIFTGMFYVPLGMVLASKHRSPFLGLILLLSGCLGACVFGSSARLLFVALFSAGMFVLVVTIRLKDSPIYSVFRDISTIVYFIHMYVWTAYYSLVYHQKTYGPDSFIIVSLVSIAVSAIYIWLRRSRSGAKK